MLQCIQAKHPPNHRVQPQTLSPTLPLNNQQQPPNQPSDLIRQRPIRPSPVPQTPHPSHKPQEQRPRPPRLRHQPWQHALRMRVNNHGLALAQIGLCIRQDTDQGLQRCDHEGRVVFVVDDFLEDRGERGEFAEGEAEFEERGEFGLGLCGEAPEPADGVAIC